MLPKDPISFAVQLVLVHVLDEIGKADPRMASAIKEGFDRAADAAELLTIRDGKTDKGQFSAEVLGVVEELRKMSVSKE